MKNFISDEMEKEAMAKARGELANMVIDVMGILDERSDAPNEIKCAAFGIKIDQLLHKISDRHNDEDVTMMRQLYEALSEREKENEA